MKKKESLSKNNINDIWFTIFYSLALFGSYLLTTPFSYSHGNLLKLFVFLSSLMSIIRIPLFNKIKSYKLIFSLMILLISILSFLRTGNFIVISFSLLLIGSTNIDFHLIAKVYFFTALVTLIIVFLCAKIGIIANFDSIGKNGQIVHAYGSIYYTNFAAHVFYIVLAYSLLKKFEFNYLDYVITFLISFWLVFKYTARLDGYLVFILLLTIIFKKKLFIFLKNKLVKKVMVIIPIFLIFLELLLCVTYKYNGIYYELDKIFSNRLSQSYIGFNNYSIKLFGQQIQMQGYGGVSAAQHAFVKYFYLDSSFVQLLLIEGLVFFVLILVLLFYNNYKFLNKNAYILCISLLLVTISSLVDENLIFVAYNFVLLATFANVDKFSVEKHENSKELFI